MHGARLRQRLSRVPRQSLAPAGKSMLIRKLPGNTGFTAVNFAAIGSIAFLTVAAAVTTTLTKHGHMTAPDEGTVLDLLRLIPYALAGLLAVRNRGGLRHVFGLTAFLVIVERLAVSLTSAGPLGSLVENLSSFFLGSALIGVACCPSLAQSPGRPIRHPILLFSRKMCRADVQKFSLPCFVRVSR